MPAHDRVRLHDDQGRSPILPRLGEQNPKQSIACAEVWTPDRAPENGQLLTQRHVLARDGSVSTTEQPDRSTQNEKRGEHALSRRPNRAENQPRVRVPETLIILFPEILITRVPEILATLS